MRRRADPSRTSPWWLAAGMGWLALALWGGCTAMSDSGEGFGGSGEGGSGGVGGDCLTCGGQPTDGATLDVAQPDSGGSGGGGGRQVCGLGDCLPDDPEACVEGGASDAGAGGAGPGTPTPPGLSGSTVSCQVSRDELSVAVRRCAPAGAQGAGAACAASADCAPGLGCVGDESGGRCRPYCCSVDTACGDGSFCAPRPLRSPPGRPTVALVVPMCVPADNCSLSEPYPCENSSTGCVCRPGTACTVVKPDGTTSCVEPGAGVAGQACPCAAGHICSQASNQCVRICRLGTAGECGSGRCQASANFPDGYGVCVSTDSDGG